MLEKFFCHLLAVEIFEKYNRFIYWLQKLPLLGRHIPNRFFKATEVKWFLFAFQVLPSIFNYLARSALYVSFAYGLGRVISNFLPKLVVREVHSPFLSALVVMICFSVFLFESFDFKMINRTDMTLLNAVRIFRIEPKSYFLANELLGAARGLIFRGSVFSVFFLLNGMSWLRALGFVLFIAGLRLSVKMLALSLYNNRRVNKEKSLNRLSVFLFLLAFGLSLTLIFLGKAFNPLLFFSWQAGLLGVALWVGGIISLKNNRDVNGLTKSLVTHEAMREQETFLENVEVQAVAVKDKDIDFSEKQPQSSQLTGIPYLNALFMKRMGKHLGKGVRIRLGIIASLIVLVLILVRFFPAVSQRTFTLKEFNSLLFISVFAGYIIYIGESYMKFCFYHLDRPLLKFNYYRQPQVVLATLKTRFVASIKHNLPIFLLLNVLYVTIYLLFFKWTLAGILLLILGQILSMTFFSFYFLYLYFLLQPFTDGMKIKSPAYSILTGIFYIGAYQIFRLSSLMNIALIIGIAMAMLAFLVLGYFAVLHFAPKTFRLKM